MAYESPGDVDAVIEAGLPRLTANTITEPVALRRELEGVRRQGYAIDDREIYDYIRCVEVPVVERDSPVRMGISCSGPDSRFTHEYLERLREPMLRASRDLSRQLGGVPPS